MEDISDFAIRLKEALGSESVNSFAKRCEVAESTMRNYFKSRLPDANLALRMADLLEVNLEWLISGREPKAKDAQAIAQAAINANISEKFTLVPRLDIQASAGNGTLALDEEPIDFIAFQENWLNSRNINPKYARALTAKGDSMEPTIRDGDMLLVDTSINQIRDNTIYVVVYGDIVLVKRVHTRFNGSVQLISDNARYPVEEINQCDLEHLHIAGRVMWFGRSI